MVKSVIQINGAIPVNIDVSVKDVMYVKKIIFGILLHEVVKIYMDDSPITSDEVIDSCNKETKTISKNLVKRKQQVKRKNSVFYLHFD